MAKTFEIVRQEYFEKMYELDFELDDGLYAYFAKIHAEDNAHLGPDCYTLLCKAWLEQGE